MTVGLRLDLDPAIDQIRASLTASVQRFEVVVVPQDKAQYNLRVDGLNCAAPGLATAGSPASSTPLDRDGWRKRLASHILTGRSFRPSRSPNEINPAWQ